MPYGTCCLRRSYFGMIAWVICNVKYFLKEIKIKIRNAIKCIADFNFLTLDLDAENTLYNLFSQSGTFLIIISKEIVIWIHIAVTTVSAVTIVISITTVTRITITVSGISVAVSIIRISIGVSVKISVI